MARPLLALLIAILALSASGLGSAAAAIIASSDDCCADGASDTQEGNDVPDGDRDPCAPFCHSCACSPLFSVPAIASTEPAARLVDREIVIGISSQLPSSPPGRGVFHPPRRST